MDLRAHHEHRCHSLVDIPVLKAWVTSLNAAMGLLIQRPHLIFELLETPFARSSEKVTTSGVELGRYLQTSQTKPRQSASKRVIHHLAEYRISNSAEIMRKPLDLSAVSPLRVRGILLSDLLSTRRRSAHFLQAVAQGAAVAPLPGFGFRRTRCNRPLPYRCTLAVSLSQR